MRTLWQHDWVLWRCPGSSVEVDGAPLAAWWDYLKASGTILIRDATFPQNPLPAPHRHRQNANKCQHLPPTMAHYRQIYRGKRNGWAKEKASALLVLTKGVLQNLEAPLRMEAIFRNLAIRYMHQWLHGNFILHATPPKCEALEISEIVRPNFVGNLQGRGNYYEVGGKTSPGVQGNPYPKVKAPRIWPIIFGR